MQNFHQKVVVLTGAGSGIGRALAQQLASEGARLVLVDWQEDSLHETQALIGGQGLCVPLDVSQKEAVYALAKRVKDEMGQVDLVINNAGVALPQQLLEHTPYEDYEKVINVNMWGVIYGSLAFLPYLRERPEAGLINVSSIFGIVGYPTSGAYCVSKFAVRGFTETLRQELAHTHVYVGCVHPGGIRTNIVRNIPIADEKQRARFVDKFDRSAQTTPEQAALTILDGIRSRKKRILIGKDAKFLDFMARLLPNGYDTFSMKGFSPKHYSR